MKPLDEAIDAIYDAAAHPERWHGAVARIAGLFHAPAGVIYGERAESDRYALMDPAVVFGHDLSYIDAYAQYYGALNPFNRHAIAGGLGILTEAFLDERTGCDFVESEYFHDWVRPQKIRHVAGQRLKILDDRILTIALWRPGDAGPYEAQEIETLGRICRHLDRTLDIGARLGTLVAEMDAVLGGMSEAVLTLGRDGRLRHANAAANALLVAGEALRSEGGRLRAAIPQDQAALDRLIASALDPRSAGRAENARIPLRDRSGKASLVVRAIAVRHRFDPFRPDRAASVILTIEGGADGSGEDRLRRRFGFSPAEARVASRILGGRSPLDVAGMLGISVETVRSHLKRIYVRTGTRHQSELIVFLQREGMRERPMALHPNG